jgi:hypothetical protein
MLIVSQPYLLLTSLIKLIKLKLYQGMSSELAVYIVSQPYILLTGLIQFIKHQSMSSELALMYTPKIASEPYRLLILVVLLATIVVIYNIERKRRNQIQGELNDLNVNWVEVKERFNTLQADIRKTEIKNQWLNELFNAFQANIRQTEMNNERIKKERFNEIENEMVKINTEIGHQTLIKNKKFDEIHTEVNERFKTIQTNIQYLQEDMQYQLLELNNNETNVKNNIVKTLKNINDIINYIDNHQINELIEQELKENRNSYKYSYAYACVSIKHIYITAEPLKVLLKYFKSQCIRENGFPVFNIHTFPEDNTNELLKMQVEYKKNYSITLPAVHELIKRYNTLGYPEQAQSRFVKLLPNISDVLNLQLNIKLIGETEDEHELRILRFCLERIQIVYWYYKCSEKLFY